MRVVVLYSQAPPGEAPWPLLPWPPMSPVIYIVRLITTCSSYLVSFENNALGLTPTNFFFQPEQLHVQALVLLADLGGKGTHSPTDGWTRAKRADGGGKGADRAYDARVGGRADGRKRRRWAVEGGTGTIEQTSERGERGGRGGRGGRVDEGVGLGLKSAIPPPHFTLGCPVRLPCQSASV